MTQQIFIIKADCMTDPFRVKTVSAWSLNSKIKGRTEKKQINI